jgi:hypothetical protein
LFNFVLLSIYIVLCGDFVPTSISIAYRVRKTTRQPPHNFLPTGESVYKLTTTNLAIIFQNATLFQFYFTAKTKPFVETSGLLVDIL